MSPRLAKGLSLRRRMSLALLLTLSRVFLGPLFILTYLHYDALGLSLTALAILLLGIVCLSELSDLFDGRLARQQNRVTDLGKLLDPMADSLFRLSVLFSFTQGPIALPLGLVCIFFYRDTLIGTLRTICALKGEVLSARLSGKVKAILQAAIIFFILLLLLGHSLAFISLETLRLLSFYSVLIGALYTAFSGVEYLYANRRHLKNVLD